MPHGLAIDRKLREVYERLFAAFGPQYWWPADSPFEVIVGAILTQSVAWTNVEKAIASLKAESLLSPRALRDVSTERLAHLVRPCGYFNAKAAKLKAMASHLEGYADDLGRFFEKDTESLREELLAIHGIGPETADSIILYAANRPSFVIDAYAQRILRRLALAPRGDRYDDFRAWMQDHLPRDVQMYNEYHALLVHLGKY